MKIGLLLPSALMFEPLSDGKIFAPKDLFVNLARGLARRGHRVRVYAAADEDLQGLDVISGQMELLLSEPPAMKLRYVEERTRKLIARAQARWEYELDLTARAHADARAGKIEIIHSFLEFASHYVAQASGVLTVYTVHDPVPDKAYLDYFRLMRFSQDNYVAISEFQAAALRKLITIAGVVYNGVDTAEYVPNLDSGDYLLFVGRYIPEKGVEDAVKAGIATKTQTILAGSKEYRRLAYFQKVIAPYLKTGSVQDVGFMGKKKRNALFAGAKALLMPILWDEPFGMVMIESMAAGTPVIAYNRGSVSEVIRDGVTGFIVNPDGVRPSSKSKWIIKKQGVAGLVEAIGRIGEIKREACRASVEQHFTTEHMVAGYEKVYKSILAR